VPDTVVAPLVLGTAGHIDHGKSALIRALTGVDTDRLPEERERGISIELGYAPLVLPGGRRVSVVDVPGHERFVRTMVAGATGIDLYLMTIAADDGVMPQTREHAAVLAALGVRAGVVAVTKTDLADPARALAEAAELLPGTEAVAVSARTGEGLDALAAALARAVIGLPGRGGAGGALVLHVDRAFTIRGAGTVVTGTLWSGSVGRGDAVELLPSRHRARVRGVQVHDTATERAEAGQRVALNLTGVAVGDVSRGDVVVSATTVPGTVVARQGGGRGVRATTVTGTGVARQGGARGVRATTVTGTGVAPVVSYRLDLALQWRSEEMRPASGARVAVHHGTREAAARLTELGGRYAQLRLERPLVARAGDRVVIRALAPPDTLGGGVVLDPAPARHGPSRDLLARLARLERGEPEPVAEPEPAPAPAPVAREPAAPGPAPLSPAALAIERELREAGAAPPLDADLDAPDELAALRDAGRAVRLGPTMHIHAQALDDVRERVVALIEADGELTLSRLRDELGTSRKYAQALLERFDAERLTLRRGDARVLRGRR
jgi:selenocysteine-specific elongation factor